MLKIKVNLLKKPDETVLDMKKFSQYELYESLLIFSKILLRKNKIGNPEKIKYRIIDILNFINIR